MTRLFNTLMMAWLCCTGQEKEDAGLRQAVERVVYGLNDSGAGRFEGVNPAQRLTLEFNSVEARLKHPQGDAVLRLTCYGYGGRLRTPLKATPAVSGNRVEYRRGELSEWYVNDSRGLEQGFTLARRPGTPRGGEPLVIALGVGGELRPELAPRGEGVLLRSKTRTVLQYAGLRAWDARGHALPSRLQVGEREVRIIVEDQAAEYPLVVDPVWTQQAELAPQDGAQYDSFGSVLSVSGDTALVASPYKTIGSNQNQGAVYVFVRSGTTWSQQAELTAADGAAGDQFGESVCLSGDTAVIGALGKAANQGAAYVYVRSGTVWSLQQELALSGGVAGDVFGIAVAVNGDTAIVGASGRTIGLNAHQGALYVFARSGTTWSQQQQLTASDGVANDYFGDYLAMTGDTALVGVLKTVGSNQHQGAVYVFARSATTWSQQQELVVPDGMAGDAFGVSVAVDGDTAVIGADSRRVGTNPNQGAAYVFVRTGTTWSLEQQLTSSDGAARDFFGQSVAVIGDTTVVGAWGKTIGSNQYEGAAYVFGRNGTTWSQQQELSASDAGSGDEFGYFVSLSGNTVVVGAASKTVGSIQRQGVAYVFTALESTFNDFAGNGRSGALLYDPSIGQSYTGLSNGDGTYTYAGNLFSTGFDTLRTGDFNGDGKADLILYNSQTASAYIGFGKGDGTFNFQSLFWSPGYDTVVTGDINGDGKTDVALYNSTTGTMYAGISNGDGTFTYKYTLISKSFTYVKLADFNGDGKADLFLYRASDGLAYLGTGDGTGAFTFNPLSISAGYNLADTGDLNGDGNADIILYNVTNGNAATGISNGSGGFTFTPLVFSPGFTAVRLGKYTGHATADVTVYNKNTAVAYFGTGNGAGNFNFISLFWSPGYDYVVPADVNADGKTDVVLYNSATGTEYTGISNGDGTFAYTYSYWGIGKVLAK